MNNLEMSHPMTLILISGLAAWFLCYMYSFLSWFRTGYVYFDICSISVCTTWEIYFTTVFLLYGDAYRFGYAGVALRFWLTLSLPLLAIAISSSMRVIGLPGTLARLAITVAANFLWFQIVFGTGLSMYMIGTLTGYACLLQISGYKLMDAMRAGSLPRSALRINVLRTYANAAVMAWDVYVSDHKLLFITGFSLVMAMDVTTTGLSGRRSRERSMEIPAR